MALQYLPLVLAALLLLLLGASGVDRRLSRWLNRLSFRIFGGFDIDPDPRRERVLRSAGIGTPYRLYAAKTYLMMVAGAICGLVFGFYLGGLLVDLLPAMPTLGAATPVDVPAALRSEAVKVAGLVLAVAGLLAGGGALGIYLVRWQIPAVRAETRRRQIDAGMPRMVAFIYALSRGGMSFPDVMRALSRNRGVFGTGAEEVGVGVRNIDLFGDDLVSAVRDLARRTPSEQFRKFAENLTSVLQSGQDLSAFLRGEYERYRDAAEEQQREVLDLLAATAEVYVTVVVAGVLFLITILLVIGITTGGMLPLIELITYVVLPATNVLFIAYLSEVTQPLRSNRESLGPDEEPAAGSARAPSTGVSARADGGAATASALARDAENRARFAAYRQLRWLRSTVASPFRSLIERPTLLLYVTVPIAAAYLLIRLPVLTGPDGFDVAAYDDVVIQGALFVLATFAAVYEIRRRRLARLEDSVPDLLERLASLNEAGVSVVTSFERVRESDLGDLNAEVDRIWRDIQWGANVTEALERFESRVRTPSVTRAVTLTTNAMRASNDIGPVLRIAAEQARNDRRLKRQRKQEMFTYLLIIYIAFFVFIVVIGAIDFVLIPSLPTSSATTSAAPVGAGGILAIGDVDVAAYQLAFFHAGVIQATMSGLVGGQMGGGSIKDGVKHAAVMLALAYVSFTVMSAMTAPEAIPAVALP